MKTMGTVCPVHSLALFQRTGDSLNLLQGFWQRDDVIRLEDLQTLQRTFDSWYFGFGSPAVAGFLESVADDTGGATLDTSMHGLIREQIPDLIRISYTGPSADIRSTAKDILSDLKTKKGFRVPHIQLQSPSFSISMEQTYALFREYWFQWGRLENYIYIMGFHPEYLECYMKIQAHLFHGDLPLPYPDRHYLAVMAAAEHKCVYLVLLFARQFLASGGDPTWLQGIQHGPVKWRKLAGLNHNLASQPWMVTWTQIHNLIHGGGAQSPGEKLSLSELMHAVAIMTHVHSLAPFVFGCGIRPEIDQHESLCNLVDPVAQTNGNGDEQDVADHTNTHWHTSYTPESPTSISNGANPTPKNHEVLNAPTDRPTSGVLSSNSAHTDQLPATQLLELIQTENDVVDEVSEDIVAEQFMVVTQLNKDLDSEYDSSSLTWASELVNTLSQHPAIARFVDHPDSGFVDFEGRPFHIAEYCWQEEGCALADRLCPDLGTFLDEKFRNTYELTYNTLNFITNVDTTLYRRSVWNHVQSLFGICHDEFRYDCIDRLLNKQQRAFLKLCATRPVAIDPARHRFEKLFPVLSPSEVVHVILMVVEARQQACLLYALRAISECQARRPY
ncbi:PA26 p53-induced protein [Opisthorchis viverrini]|uniref:PA26 p53-induced protein n=1 Tax=Opisthorchis viverrini TaxID=6198 RepID=A0A1S8WW14_OPIVI|nr:PA26 p53-induced protein [Opisthorchis viverrini]